MKLIAQRPHIAGVVDSYSEATFEDIQQAHPKCGACAWHEEYRHHWWASKPDATAHRCNSRAFTIAHKSNLDPKLDYCRHHKPKEGV